MDDSKHTDATSLEAVQHRIDSHGFLSWLGFTVELVEEGRVVATVPRDPKITNNFGPDGQVHGGVAATLIDTVGGIVCRTELGPDNRGVATIDLDVSYLRSASGDLRATAEVVRVGGTVGVADVTVESNGSDGEWEKVAVGRGSYRVFRE